MRISNKRKSGLYSAISETIMKERIYISRNYKGLDEAEVDLMLFKLETEIWQKVKIALKIECG